jgi:mono/diheme cytochrome c family protein
VILPDGSVQAGQVLVNTNGAPSQPAVGSSLSDPMALAGEKLFTNLGCVGCHVMAGGGTGPSLKNVFGFDQALADGTTATADENYIRESILNSMAKVVKGYQPVMPAYQGQLSDDQVNQLLAYVKSLSTRGATAPPAPVATVAAGATAAPAGTAAPRATAAPLTLPSPTAASGGSAGGPFNADLAAKGQQIFTNLGCVGCHKNDGTGLGPILKGVYNSTVTLADGSTVKADEAYLRESILNSTAKVVKDFNPIMPAYKGQIKDDEVAQLIEYIKSLGSAGN